MTASERRTKLYKQGDEEEINRESKNEDED
jgi:hypothetical protein